MGESTRSSPQNTHTHTCLPRDRTAECQILSSYLQAVVSWSCQTSKSRIAKRRRRRDLPPPLFWPLFNNNPCQRFPAKNRRPPILSILPHTHNPDGAVDPCTTAHNTAPSSSFPHCPSSGAYTCVCVRARVFKRKPRIFGPTTRRPMPNIHKVCLEREPKSFKNIRRRRRLTVFIRFSIVEEIFFFFFKDAGARSIGGNRRRLISALSAGRARAAAFEREFPWFGDVF